MAREIDERKKRKALRKLRRAAQLAEQGLGPPLSEWEVQFLEEVEARIETYGSAFADPEKGSRDEPLSALQSLKLREIDKKTRGKSKSGFKSRTISGQNKAGPRRTYSRDINADTDDAAMPIEPKRTKPELVKTAEQKSSETLNQPPKPADGRPHLRVIKGGAAED